MGVVTRFMLLLFIGQVDDGTVASIRPVKTCRKGKRKKSAPETVRHHRSTQHTRVALYIAQVVHKLRLVGRETRLTAGFVDARLAEIDGCHLKMYLNLPRRFLRAHDK